MQFDDLVAVLQDEGASLDARHVAARDLASMGDPRCDVMLAVLARTTDRELRHELVYDLGQIRDARAFDAFAAIIRDANEVVELRGLAAELIANFSGVDAVPVLVESIYAAEPMIRFDAAWSLVSVGDDRARAVLESHVSDPDCPYANEESIGEIVKRALEAIEQR